MTNPLLLLVGAWRGEGSGSYPGVPPFGFVEETVVTMEADWGMLRVLQRTWQHDGDSIPKAPLHMETGIVVAKGDGTWIYNCAQEGGRVEVMTATPAFVDGVLRLSWVTVSHANDPRLVRAGRDWIVDGASFVYEAFLSTVRTPEYRRHLAARLARKG